jgi:hypothetical protein
VGRRSPAAALAILLALPGSAAAGPSGCDVVGTSGDDVLIADSQHGAVICGLDGDDVLVGRIGRDTLIGGPGRDLLRGASVADTLRGRGGADVLAGDQGNDRVLGGPGRDGCTQGPGRGRNRGCEVRAYAEAGDILLLEPARRVVGYGFHESLFETALPQRPLGRIRRNDNPAKFRPPPPADGPPYVVMGTRHRPTGATTSADVVVPSRARVRSPVTGEVVLVERYLLYCDSPDWKVVIRPHGARSLRVIVLHLAHVRVRDGEDVTAGRSTLGRAAVNDASSAQENQYFPDGYPHVHIEVERDRAAPTPGCSL